MTLLMEEIQQIIIGVLSRYLSQLSYIQRRQLPSG